METVASSYLRGGDVASAANLYASMERLNAKYSRMARICRVLADPAAVPLPHRHNDMCEAICSSLVPPELLMGTDPTPEAIQKKFQRLAVYVHPDKNPHPQAGESFQRLTAMRDEALRLLDQRRAKAAEERSGAAASEDAVRRKEKGKKGRTKKATAPASQPQSAGETAIISNLNALKQTRITLKSLKRKEIDDSFEIFSSTRGARMGRAAGHSDALDDDDNEVALAATAPARFVLPKEVRPPPKKADGVRGRPLPIRKPEPPVPSHSPADGGSHGASTSLTFPGSHEGSSPPSSGIESINELSSSGPPPNMEDDDKRTLRDQIDSVRASLAAMRANHAGIRLSCDLSFDAYQRDKAKNPS